MFFMPMIIISMNLINGFKKLEKLIINGILQKNKYFKDAYASNLNI